ncbi:hypothetical protein SAMN06265795_111126 [Noviherbaspirillum humi]|uniref:Uncharacterized protein n=1 Tax=Noviherbaspirillum humi TaxID=1688639 RepID=A0A239J523_9BURK|nr:hypothetical protein [Noviherbaspirillum humi]SNT00991.1 hypothetical protein SAMN06265795_111126 [Noviherbaspirillum humi]
MIGTWYRRRILRGAWAGLLAGAVATVLQLLLWFATGAPLPDIFLRDAQLAAAILLGPAVLPPPIAASVNVMLAASAVHLLLSAAYGWTVDWLMQADTGVHAGSHRRWLVIGPLFGLALYAINMHGFTLIFPWFEVNRDWITVLAHLAFGVTAARLCGKRSDAEGRK